MGLEAASFLDDLNVSNPLGTDFKNAGDNHIRMIKAVLKATFPGLAGASWRIQDKASGYTVLATDNMSVIRCTAVLTLALTAAATLGNQHMFIVYADGGDVTINPDGAETINGGATLTIPDNGVAAIFCNGALFYGFALVLADGSLPLTTASAEFASGTKMVFHNATAPTGWTQDTALNDKVLRVQDSNSVATGGSWTISGLTNGNVGATALTEAQMPAHDHGGATGSHTHSGDAGTIPSRSASAPGGEASAMQSDVSGTPGTIPITPGTTGGNTASIASAGSGATHTHTGSTIASDAAWRPAHVDVMIAEKD